MNKPKKYTMSLDTQLLWEQARAVGRAQIKAADAGNTKDEESLAGVWELLHSLIDQG